MLTINHLTASHNRRQFLNVSSLTVKPGEVVAIVGPNGAGKTTLLNSLTSSNPQHLNDIELHHKPLSMWPRRVLAQHVGILPQHHQLSFPFTVRKVIEMGATPLKLNTTALETAVSKWLTFTDTHQFSNTLYPKLSGGEKQRVHLARVLLQLSQAKQAPLLLLDEPTSAQDIGQQHALLAQLRTMATQQNYMIIMILHDLNLASRYCDKVWLIKEGKLTMQGAPTEVLTPQIINNIWGYQPQKLITESGETVFF
jgi:iron complex transport system ATP-binding protein